MNILIPMAGNGKRFADAGYKLPKPLIPVNGRPMIIQALEMLTKQKTMKIFVCQKTLLDHGIDKLIIRQWPNANFVTSLGSTEGQACTCLLAKGFIDNREDLLISACDIGCIYDEEKLQHLKQHSDVVVFTFRNHCAALNNPEQYGWVKVNDRNLVTGISIKKPLSDNPLGDHAIVGTFWFRCGSIFVDAAEEMITRDERINNEFYIDKCLDNLVLSGFRVAAFEVDKFLCWGTPKDLQEYEKGLGV